MLCTSSLSRVPFGLTISARLRLYKTIQTRGNQTGRNKKIPRKLTFPGGLPYKNDGDAHRKIQIKPLRETNVGVAPKGDLCVVSDRAFFVNSFRHSTKRYLNGSI